VKPLNLIFFLVMVLAGSSCQNYNCSWERLAPYAKLTRPEGEGPFPAVVLLHGCGGMASSYPHHWDQRLTAWGYVSLHVDSFAPRGITGICAGGMIAVETLSYRVKDAYLAKKYLSTLSYVDSDRIGVMGWSHGGTTAVKTVLTSGEPKRTETFDRAVAFYPWCYKPIEPASPLLILSGGQDRWTPVEFCLRHAPVDAPTDMFRIEVYPEAHHCFDWVGIDTEQQGHILRYHPESAADAFAKVKAFLNDKLDSSG
jgi:dienelactone hydrolase